MVYIFKHYSKTAPTGTGITFTAYKLPSYSITYNLTNLTSDTTNPITIGSGEVASIKITAPTGYNLPSKITVTGCEYTWEANTGVLNISNPTGNITITAEGVAETYSVTLRLKNVVGESTNPTTVSYGGNATFKFNGEQYYDLPASVEQTGASSYSWDKSTGTLVLTNITGPVTIIIVGVATIPQLTPPTNLIADNTTVKWDEVTNATSYDIYVDGELYENTTGISRYNFTYAFSDIIGVGKESAYWYDGDNENATQNALFIGSSSSGDPVIPTGASAKSNKVLLTFKGSPNVEISNISVSGMTYQDVTEGEIIDNPTTIIGNNIEAKILLTLENNTAATGNIGSISADVNFDY